MKLVNKEHQTDKTVFEKGNVFLIDLNVLNIPFKPYIVTHSVPIYQVDRDGIQNSNAKKLCLK